MFESFQFVKVRRGKGCESSAAATREVESHDAVIVGIRVSLHEAGQLGAIDELDDTVVT